MELCVRVAALPALLLAVAAVAAGAAAPRAMECPAHPFTVNRVPDDENAPYRLSKNVRPEHYDLFIVTNVGDGGKFEFQGRVNIKVNVFEDTEQFRFHARNLVLEDVTVTELPEQRTIAVKSQAPNAAQETVDVELSQPLRKGVAYVIGIDFHANLSNGLNGLYRSSYFDKASNSTRWLATTHFEPTAARKAFPCFDEPIMKATFTIVIGHNSSLTAISNMPAEKTEPYSELPGYSLTHFAKTVPMSTYLIAFVVSDFERVVSEQKEGEAQVSIWARRDAIDQMAYARDLSPLGLRFFEDYFQVKYPLPKQDMVAIPDFSAGAMENWGLITYREIQLLLDPASTSRPTEANLAATVVHEWAHQWFGNLVTMKWWSDLWLNEGFATYMAALAIAKIYPTWNYMDEVVMENTINVFAIDALDSTHPVVRTLSHPDQISQSFDHITYKKGSALLSMMQSFLGEEVFRRGVINYIQKHKYSNAEQDDLWDALTAEAHKQHTLPECLTVKMVMDTWTVQSGFPVITVTRDYENGLASVSQERYKADGIQAKENTCWYVPLSYTSQDAPNFDEVKPRNWMTCDSKEQVINEVAPKDKWVIFNIGLRALYRVQYDDHNWELIIKAMADPSERQRIGQLNRVQLYLDSFALARSGRLPYSIPLRLAATLRGETGHLPWRAALGALGVLEHHAKRTPHYEQFRAFIRHILTPEVKNVSDLVKEEPGFQSGKHKTLILSWACSHDLGSCVDDSLHIFKKWRVTADPDTVNPVPRDLRRMVYCTAMKYGRPADWFWLWQRYQNTNSAAERLNVLAALSCTRDVWQMRRYLEWALDPSYGVRAQDSEYIFSGVASTEAGFYLAREFLYTRIAEISKQLTVSDSSRIGRWVGAIASRLSTDRDLEEFIAFTKREESFLKGGDQAVRQAVERARIAVQWRKDHLQEMFGIIGKLNAMFRSSS